MKEKLSVLILEDETNVRDAMVRGFGENTAYDFQVEVAESLEDCIAKGCDRRRYDVCVIDLELERGTFLHGFLAVFAFEVPGSVAVVYSRHAQTKNVVKAIQSGAKDFIVKGECLPHELPDRVVKLLDALRTEDDRHQKLSDLADQNAAEWGERYPGSYIAVVGDRVICSAETRLRTLLEYNKQRETDPNLPEEPYLLQIAIRYEVSP